MGDARKTLLVNEIIESAEATSADKAFKVITAIKQSTERVYVLDFLKIDLVNLAFLMPLAKFIVNEASNRITIIGLSDNQRELVREAFMSARRL